MSGHLVLLGETREPFPRLNGHDKEVCSLSACGKGRGKAQCQKYVEAGDCRAGRQAETQEGKSRDAEQGIWGRTSWSYDRPLLPSEPGGLALWLCIFPNFRTQDTACRAFLQPTVTPVSISKFVSASQSAFSYVHTVICLECPEIESPHQIGGSCWDRKLLQGGVQSHSFLISHRT